MCSSTYPYRPNMGMAPPPPPPFRAHNVAQINKVSNEFQFRHRRPKLTLRGMGDAWHLCWMRRYAPRYRWPLKTRDFLWEIKCWDLRTLNNVKYNFRSMKWMQTTYLRCIAPCFGVCLSLYCFFFLVGGGGGSSLHNHCYSLHKTKSRLLISKTGSIVYL